MNEIRFTLVTKGPTDVVLMPILKWLLQEQGVSAPIAPSFSEIPGRLPVKGLAGRIEYAVNEYPCELLFIHRDSDKELPRSRRNEIETALESLKNKLSIPPSICVVPVRMTEAWLLIDESAIRRASGKPNGRLPLKLPKVAELESLSNPKETLLNLLLQASELAGRKRRKFERASGSRQVADFLDDFSPLRGLWAFQKLEKDVKQVVNERQWNRLS